MIIPSLQPRHNLRRPRGRQNNRDLKHRQRNGRRRFATEADWAKDFVFGGENEVARYSFWRPIPPKFEHKVCRHKQSFGRIATTVVLDNDENLLWSGCNDIGVVIATKCLPPPISYFSSAMIPGTGTSQNCSQELSFSNTVASMFVKFKQNLKSVIQIFWNEVFIIRNTVRTGKSWFLVVICRKWSAFDSQFHLIVVLICLKACVKDRGDSSAWLLESKEGFD